MSLTDAVERGLCPRDARRRPSPQVGLAKTLTCLEGRHYYSGERACARPSCRYLSNHGKSLTSPFSTSAAALYWEKRFICCATPCATSLLRRRRRSSSIWQMWITSTAPEWASWWEHSPRCVTPGES